MCGVKRIAFIGCLAIIAAPIFVVFTCPCSTSNGSEDLAVPHTDSCNCHTAGKALSCCVKKMEYQAVDVLLSSQDCTFCGCVTGQFYAFLSHRQRIDMEQIYQAVSSVADKALRQNAAVMPILSVSVATTRTRRVENCVMLC